MKRANIELEKQIEIWRRGLRTSGNLLPDDEEELEGHLRDEISDLTQKGLDPDEAFLISIRRLGTTNTIAREFYKINGRKLWKHLELPRISGQAGHSGLQNKFSEVAVIVGLAILSALIAQLPYLFGATYIGPDSLSAIRQSLFLFFPGLVTYMIWKRRLGLRYFASAAIAIIIGAVFINIYPYTSESDTLNLSLIHLALLFWALFGLLYTARGNRQVRGYVDFLRFSGEIFIYTVLVVLGGGVFLGIGNAIFGMIGIDISILTQRHLIIAGAFGAPIIGAYLVEAKREVIENIAPVLAKIFVPLFCLLLLGFLVALAVTGASPFLDREPLIILDLLLFLVLAMVFYSISSRDETAPVSLTDYANCALLAASIIVDVVALSAILYRLSTYGISPNKLAALGENLLMLIHLVILFVTYTKHVFKRSGFDHVEKWTAKFVVVYGFWFFIVALIMPLLFGFR